MTPILPEKENEPLRAELAELNQLLKQQIALQRNWRISLRNGILAGFGGVLGATILVSLLVTILQPFKRLEGLGPLVDKLDRIVTHASKAPSK